MSFAVGENYTQYPKKVTHTKGTFSWFNKHEGELKAHYINSMTTSTTVQNIADPF